MESARKMKPQIEDNFILVRRDRYDSKQPEQERKELVPRGISNEEHVDSETHPSKIEKTHDIARPERKQTMLEFYKPL